MRGHELGPQHGPTEQERFEIPSSTEGYSPPIRVVTAGETYVQDKPHRPKTRNEIAKQGIREVDSSEGISRFGMPEFFGIKDKKQMYERIGQALWEEMGEYHDPSRIRGVESTLKERLGLQDAVVVIGSSGSDGLLMDVQYKFLLPDTPTFGSGVQFPQMAYYAMSRGSEDLYISAQPRIRTPEHLISPLSFTLNAGMDKMIRELEDEKDTGEKKLLYICNPGTPLGDVGDIQKIRRLAELAQQNNHILLVDEAFGDVLDPEESAIPLTDEFDSVMVTRTLSKFYGMPESGIGYMTMSKKLGEMYQRLLPPYSFRGPQLFIAEHMFTTNIMDDFRRRIKPQMRARKTQLMNRLRDFGVSYLPTDPRVPILTVVGPDEGYHARLKNTFHLPTAKGSGFAVTDDYFTDQMVRVAIQNNERRVGHQAYILNVAYNR